MNVYIVAEREVLVKKNGKFITDVQRIRFDAAQTSTIDTYNILQSEDPIEAYTDYIKSRSQIEKVPVYAIDDFLNERDPIYFEDYDWTVEHVKEFQKWVTEKRWQSYKIKFEVM